MTKSQELAKKNACHFIAVNTMDFEALGFYQKLRFYIEFERKGFAKNSRMYFLRKNILKNDSADNKQLDLNGL